jgi:ubiquinone/menaquinone biosynthesis C-methylase UbiE
MSVPPLSTGKLATVDPQNQDVKEFYRKLAPEYEARANQTCEQAYFQLLARFLGNRQKLLELGCGSSNLLSRLGNPLGVACDLSIDMLRLRTNTSKGECVAAAGENLPFLDGHFDGVFAINLLEHVSDVAKVVSECARVLDENGLWLSVTPNGNWEYWLNLAERWSLKIPEGPHRFLRPHELLSETNKWFEIIEFRTFLVLPVGSWRMAMFLDKVTFAAALKWGFFQYVVARKRRY